MSGLFACWSKSWNLSICVVFTDLCTECIFSITHRSIPDVTQSLLLFCASIRASKRNSDLCHLEFENGFIISISICTINHYGVFLKVDYNGGIARVRVLELQLNQVQ